MVTVGNITFGNNGRVTTKDPFTGKQKTISTPAKSYPKGRGSSRKSSSSFEKARKQLEIQRQQQEALQKAIEETKRKEEEARKQQEAQKLRDSQQKKLQLIALLNQSKNKTNSIKQQFQNISNKISWETNPAIQNNLILTEEVYKTKTIQGQKVPITRTIVVNTNTGTKRLATKEEQKLLNNSRSNYLEVPKKQNIRKKVETYFEKQTGGSQKKGILEGAKQTGLGVLSGARDFVFSTLDLPSTAKTIVSNPALLLQFPSLIKQQAEGFGTFIRQNPSGAVGYVAGNILVAEGSSRAITILTDLSKTRIAKLSKNYLGDLKTGDVVNIPIEGKKVRIKVVGKIPTEKISKQLSKAGKQIDYAISSQRNKLLNLIKREKIVRKPIAGEEKFDKLTKNLLKKFDSGKINAKQLIQLDQRIRRYGAKGILERSFFASPGGELRPSRLGITKENRANLLDYLSGQDITLRTPKPQVLVFRNVNIQDFPVSLKNIIKKIKSGKTLTNSETGKLLKFQLQKSGKFKPLGFISGEKEITLAPGELIKKRRVIGKTIINGKVIPLVEAEVYSPKGNLKGLINKLKKENLTQKELKKLNKLLKRETKLDYNLSSSINKKYLNIKGYKLGAISKGLSKISKLGSSKIRYTKYGKPYIMTSSGARFISKSSISKGGKYIGKSKFKSSVSKYPLSTSKLSKKATSKYRSPLVPIKRRIPKHIVRKVIRTNNKQQKLITKSKPIQAYNVYAKSGNKFIRINKVPLSKNDALARGSFAVDNTISKQFKIVPLGKKKKIGIVSSKEKNYFLRTGRKFREYKIRKKKKYGLLFKFIEKRKYGLDTRGEKRGLGISRAFKQKTIKRTPKRKITASQRQILLARLKKARAVRMRNLKKRK